MEGIPEVQTEQHSVRMSIDFSYRFQNHLVLAKADDSHKSHAEVKKSTVGKAQDNSRYIPVEREWAKGKESRQVMAQKLESEQTNVGSRFMLQRWQQETTLDQPYHNLEAVKKHADRGDAHQTSMQNENDSSIEYFER
ncbi:hypothetical protein JMJ35_007672 [Cladonia borealis]|uniref:Uncharacterized protein n=1 Tax=Cladonia borealis TaxID=184061 RepID=A0AA39QYY1_9LECA|nr:hypothetical protein JMJ35_007672 [Cladonia borealis]